MKRISYVFLVTATIVCSGLLTVVGSAGAQDALTLVQPGASVRIWWVAHQIVKQDGVVSARRGDSIVVKTRLREPLGSEVHTEVLPFRIADLDSIEVWMRRRSKFRVSSGLGCLAGGVVALIFTVHEVRTNSSWNNSPGPVVVPIAGCGVGALIASMASADNWAWIPVPVARVRSSR